MTDAADRNRGGRPSNLAREAVRRARLEAIVATGALEAAGAALAIINDSDAAASVRLQAATLLSSLSERGIVPPKPEAPTDAAGASDSVNLLGEVLRRLEARGDFDAGLVILPRDDDVPEPPVAVPAPFPWDEDHGAADDGPSPPAATAPGDDTAECASTSGRNDSPERGPEPPPGGWTNRDRCAARDERFPDHVGVNSRPRLSLVEKKF